MVSKKLGLPSDVIVYQGGIDAHTAMLGIGVSRPGDMGIVMGSSFVHLVLSKEPVFSDGIWGPYNNAVVPRPLLPGRGPGICGFHLQVVPA